MKQRQKSLKNALTVMGKLSPVLFAAWVALAGYGSYLHVRHTLMNNNSFFSISAAPAEPVDQSATFDEGCGCPTCCALAGLL